MAFYIHGSNMRKLADKIGDPDLHKGIDVFADSGSLFKNRAGEAMTAGDLTADFRPQVKDLAKKVVGPFDTKKAAEDFYRAHEEQWEGKSVAISETTLDHAIAKKHKVEKRKAGLDLFADIIKAVNCKKLDFYATATAEERKAIEQSFWMLQRWLSCTDIQNRKTVYFLNELINSDWSAMTAHPELRWMLFAMCGLGAGDAGRVRYHQNWVGVPTAARALNELEALVAEYNPGIRDSEIDMLLEMHSKEEVRDWAASMGCSDARLKEVFGAAGKESKQ